MRLVWLDLETTGLDPLTDQTLEIAAVCTDEDLNERGRFHAVVQFDGEVSEFISDMHTSNGLLAACRNSALTEEQAADALFQWVESQAQRDDAVEFHDMMLAGSGVAMFDFPWIKAKKWEVERSLRYYVIDVGIMRRGLRLANPALVPDMPKSSGPEKTHRAMDDVEAHVQEFRAMRTLLSE